MKSRVRASLPRYARARSAKCTARASAAGVAVFSAACSALFSACSAQPGLAPATNAVHERGLRRSQTTPIEHVIIIVQENRTVDNLFNGFPGADTVTSGLNSHGKTIHLKPISLAEPYDMDNGADGFFVACDGASPSFTCKMDGFDREAVYGNHNDYPHPQYGYVPQPEVRHYWDLANQYVLADRMFTSQIDGSFVSHQYLVAGYASHAVNFPSTKWHCTSTPGDHIYTLTKKRTYGHQIPVCLDNPTLADELDAAGLSWRYYASGLHSTGGLWSAYGAIRHIRYGADWNNVISPPAKFLDDIAGGTLANVTWITPIWRHSDHASSQTTLGPHWVNALVNAIGRSPFWNTTAIFLMWDDWGGWYDHVPPPYVDYDGLGFRVPLVIVSPYAKQGYVSHVQYEHGSLLRFVEDNWGLAPLADSDARANDPASDAFSFLAAPRKFRPIPEEYSDQFFLKAADEVERAQE
jgi:phospholipase C